MPFYVYILKCADSSYYTGQTDDLDNRMAEHISGALPSCYTFSRRPVELVFTQSFTTRDEALSAELQVKGWSRGKKEAMIRGDWNEVSRLAKRKCALRQAQGERIQTIQENQNLSDQNASFDRLRTNGLRTNPDNSKGQGDQL